MEDIFKYWEENVNMSNDNVIKSLKIQSDLECQEQSSCPGK